MAVLPHSNRRDSSVHSTWLSTAGAGKDVLTRSRAPGTFPYFYRVAGVESCCLLRVIRLAHPGAVARGIWLGLLYPASWRSVEAAKAMAFNLTESVVREYLRD